MISRNRTIISYRKPPDKCAWNRKPALKIGFNRQTARL